MRGHYGVVPQLIPCGSVKQMERKEILEKLKTTEVEIRNNIETAQHKKNAILAQAQKQAQKLEEEGERRIKKEREKLLKVANKSIHEKRQRILKKALTDAETMKKKVQTNKAKEFFIEKFKEYMHV
jgi:vacuolar-type H+-ATPase subunit H